MLTAQEAQEFKKILQEDKHKTLADLKELESPPDFGNEPGPEDEIDEAKQAFDNEGSAKSYRRRISEIDAALARIEKGTYGVCEKTGKEIPKEVLEINPVARFHPDYLKQSHNP
ncbi:hypothetical protein A2755_03380 [Candidatus Wolfebacteria bacterium RIFCSPHIGHO2_01_FULL_48_22]|uniref:Uncharacterized protein n=2 Tax=Candidatus Wolfeibacteriota TaxID=1752735 RepID=A0A1F8DRH8_9BACT|nr:MAG: hypothetical protein A2755_03380 [Candidatus Wolfebacteria bacterium RIFCSPHIGHO2_01_FULL_48_22]OGM92069.1 MAG: hypothetical protein A2935_01870 [Candidatus Wolfebacteria bacterium RIFCSPLOWO2_01_FULL_47_17b]